MYARETSHETRPEVLVNAIREIKFAALVSMTGDGLQASHLPMIVENIDGQAVLNGHLSRNNPHWRAIAGSAASIAVFQGPHSYISPSLYATKVETGKVVPTWGYIAVHAHGDLEVIDDADWLRGHVGDLTDFHEQTRSSPWAVEDAPDDYIKVMLRGIVGVRMTVGRLEGSWKLNQHRSKDDQLGTIEGLAGDGAPLATELSRAMQASVDLQKQQEAD